MAQLVERGYSRAQIKENLAQGTLYRAARQWFADQHTPTEPIRAVQLGGRLGCVSACRHHELWVPHDRDLHVAMNPGRALPVNPPAGVQFHRLSTPCATAVLPLEDAVAQVVQRHNVETGLIVLESAVNSGRLHPGDARHILNGLPARKARAAQFFSPLAESGSETRLRLFFQRRRIPVQPQARIPGVGRVDLLVGRSWIVEADSTAHHSARLDVRKDRARDVNAQEQGYDRLRLSYEQIWYSWEQTQLFLVSKLETKAHLRPPEPLYRSV